MKNRLLNFRTLLFIIIVAFQSTWYALIVARQVATPDTLKGVDYIAIYTAGYIARYQGLPQTYDLNLQRRVEDMAAYPLQLGRLYPYNHPPFLVHILQWVTTRNYTASFYRWVLVLLVFHLIILGLLAHLLHLYGWRRKGVWIASISGLLFYPIFAAYLKGQDSAFLLLGITLWTYGLLTSKDRLAGLGLVLAAIRPQIALILAIPFLFKQRKVFWWFVAWGFIFLVYSYLLIGAQGLKDFVQSLFFSAGGMGIDVDKMPTLMGAVVRAVPTISSQYLNIIGYSGYALAALLLCVVWAKCQRIEFRQIGLAILLSIFFSPHLHSHDLSLLLIPALGVAFVLVEHKMLSQENAAFLPLAVSLVFLVLGVFWSYPVIYLSILLLGLLLWSPGWRRIYLTRPNG